MCLLTSPEMGLVPYLLIQGIMLLKHRVWMNWMPFFSPYPKLHKDPVVVLWTTTTAQCPMFYYLSCFIWNCPMPSTLFLILPLSSQIYTNTNITCLVSILLLLISYYVIHFQAPSKRQRNTYSRSKTTPSSVQTGYSNGWRDKLKDLGHKVFKSVNNVQGFPRWDIYKPPNLFSL